MSQPSRSVVLWTCVLLSVIWGTTWAAVRLSLTGFPPLTGVALRFALAGFLLLALARWRGRSIGRGRRERRLWAVQSLLTFGAGYWAVYWGQQWVPSGLTSVLFATMPLFVALQSLAILPAERPGRLTLLGVLLGFAGVGVIFADDLGALADPAVVRGALVVLLAPSLGGLGQVLVKRWGPGADPLSITAVPMVLGAVVSALGAATFERGREIEAGTGPVLAVLYLAVVGSALSFSLYFWLLRHVTALQVSLIAYGTPVVAVTLGTVVFGEPLTPLLIAGGALVIAGAALASRPGRRGSPALAAGGAVR